MATNKDYCDYATCVALSELGCPVPKYATINIHTKEKEWKMWLTLYEAQKWLRKDKQIEVNAAWDNEKSYWFWYINEMTDIDYYNSIVSKSTYNSYEEALLEGIKEAIKILKKDDND